MAFVLTLMYIAFSLLSPGVLPDAIVKLHVNEIFGLLAILAALTSIAEAKLGSIPGTYFVLGVLLATMVSTIATGWVGGAMTAFTNFAPIIFTFYFVAIACRSLKRMKIMVGMLVAVAFFIFAQGLIAQHTGNFTSLYLEPEGIGGAVLYRYRGLGVLSDPNDLAQLFVMLIPLLWLRWKKGGTAGNLCFTIVPALILLAGIYFTHSRGAIIAVMAVLLFTFKDKIGLVMSSILTGGAALAVTALNVSGGRAMNDDDGGRLEAWITGLAVFRGHPIFGVGPNRFGEFNDTGLTAHNSYVLCLAELGVFGYFFWIGMIVAAWTGLYQVIQSRTVTAPAVDAEPEEESSYAPAPKGSQLIRPASWMETTEKRGAIIQPGARLATVPAVVSNAYQPIEMNMWPSTLNDEEGSVASDRPVGEEDFVHAAKVFRIAFVGLLTAAFFLSRTYSLTLYLMLGMAAALKTINQESLPAITTNTSQLLKRIGLIIVGSVAMLYLLARLHGAG